eukprot:TRINITY_DN23501_c0_g1_i2.p1 TRINITY_DN23501_c0_g1~~TRINITY_DN23501_c0_g1_i2.p1  ORF type:complete len:173 (+),score=30.74 TRINITY_DN23501_c0_g1_i2:400-918(+)
MSSLSITVNDSREVGRGERSKRLLGSIRVLFHATTPQSACSIQKEGFLRGKSGKAGGGIYFAFSAAEAERKAVSAGGVVLVCVVLVGKELVTTGLTSYTFTELQAKGFDSVHLTGLGADKDELIVYNYDQVPVSIVHSGITAPFYLSRRNVPRDFFRRYAVSHGGARLCPKD